jgi:hypothetical protein
VQKKIHKIGNRLSAWFKTSHFDYHAKLLSDNKSLASFLFAVYSYSDLQLDYLRIIFFWMLPEGTNQS